MLVGGAAQLGHRQVGVVGGPGRDVGAAVVGAFEAGAGHFQVVRGQAQVGGWGEGLLLLEQIQPLLHLPLELLVLQLLLLVHTLGDRRWGGGPG